MKPDFSLHIFFIYKYQVSC